MKAQPIENYGLLVRHVARGFTRVLQDELAGSGITGGEYRVLRAIQEGPRMQSEIAQLAAMDRPFVAALIKKLTVKGLITGRPNREDRRRIDVRLTARGERLVAATSAKITAIGTRVATRGLSAAELRAFAAVAKRMVTNFEEFYTARGEGTS
jgi:DNA-binding MarR family transcriptional regulator